MITSLVPVSGSVTMVIGMIIAVVAISG
eukprot:SAG31_NODE_42448_length_271_cov_1.191860_1_plen_27_part_01